MVPSGQLKTQRCRKEPQLKQMHENEQASGPLKARPGESGFSRLGGDPNVGIWKWWPFSWRMEPVPLAFVLPEPQSTPKAPC